MFRNTIPVIAGGGTVNYVTKQKQIYTKNNEEREEGGTPAIIESIRLGLVFKLKEFISPFLIEQREQRISK